jgi:small subunit ribosomal protein S16
MRLFDVPVDRFHWRGDFMRFLLFQRHFPNIIAPFFKIQGNDMVVIRLARSGAKKRPFYNMVVADSRNRRDGRFVERIGFYNPVASGNAPSLQVDTGRLTYWQSQGVQLSPTVARLVKQFNVSKAAV